MILFFPVEWVKSLFENWWKVRFLSLENTNSHSLTLQMTVYAEFQGVHKASRSLEGLPVNSSGKISATFEFPEHIFNIYDFVYMKSPY